MKKRSLIALLLVALMMLSACTPAATTTAATTAATTTATTAATTAVTTAATTTGTTSASGSPYDKLDKIYIGVAAAMTGTNKLNGDYVRNGSTLAMEQINAAGGVLGKQIELVFEDEVDNQAASVNAMTKLINNDKVSAFVGSMYSAYCIAVSPQVLEKKIPMLACGSSANIPKQNNPYIWQARVTDDQSGLLLAKAYTEKLKLKDPAILHIAESFGDGLRDQTVAAFASLGITVDPKKIFAHTPEEKQFVPILNQIMASGADGMIAITHQVPGAMIAMQADDAGLDIPKLGSSSFASTIVLTTAGTSAEGWYAVADWTNEVTTDAGKAFVEAYQKRYNSLPDLAASVPYDSVRLIAEAIRIGGSADPQKINESLAKVNNFPGAMSTFIPNQNRVFGTAQFLTLNKDGKATMLEVVKAR